MNDKVSIIVPIYNTSKYLKTCIDTLIHQTYQNLQIILVNDGSTDHSLEICQGYAKEDSRIVIVDKKNEGLERARRSGYQYADGEWVIHVDSDDYLPLDAVETYLKYAEDDVDIIIGSWYRVLDTKGFIRKKYHLEPLDVDHKTFMENYYISLLGEYKLPVNVWGRIYRKRIIDQAKLKEAKICFGEDVCYNLQVYPYARRVKTIPEIVYNYRWGGMTERMNKRLLTDAKTAFRMKKEKVEEYQIKDGMETIVKELRNFFFTYMELYQIFTDCSKQEIISECKQEWLSDELQYARKALEKMNVPKESKTECFISGDLSGLYDLIHTKIAKKKFRRKMIGIVQKILLFND